MERQHAGVRCGKAWEHRDRRGVELARCTVERPTRRMGPRGVKRGKVAGTTVSDDKASSPLDKVNRLRREDWRTWRWAWNLTQVSIWQSRLYLAFGIDVFTRLVMGWRVSSWMSANLVREALEQALKAGQPDGDCSSFHYSDRESQYGSIRYIERPPNAEANY